MRIDGKAIAQVIKLNLQRKVDILKNKNILPHLAVILIGNDPGSQVYVRRKEKFGEEIGAKVTVYRYATISKEELLCLIDRLNKDRAVHGIIVQRPVPLDITKEEFDRLVVPNKDVDGFHPNSPFNPPIAKAVMRILENVYQIKKTQDTSEVILSERSESKDSSDACLPAGRVEESASSYFIDWLKKQKILVIGRGETAGKPLADYLLKNKIKFTVAHSKTKNLKGLCLKSDIVLSCVGKSHIVRHNMITNKTILIGVGLHPEGSKLATDYNQEDVAHVAAFYTPVPGGVGPVNVACLFENLIKAANFKLPRSPK